VPNDTLNYRFRLYRASCSELGTKILQGDSCADILTGEVGLPLKLDLLFLAKNKCKATVGCFAVQKIRFNVDLPEHLEPAKAANALATPLDLMLREWRPKRCVVVIVEANSIIAHAKAADAIFIIDITEDFDVDAALFRAVFVSEAIIDCVERIAYSFKEWKKRIRLGWAKRKSRDLAQNVC
jgi:hypothetical protein